MKSVGFMCVSFWAKTHEFVLFLHDFLSQISWEKVQVIKSSYYLKTNFYKFI